MSTHSTPAHGHHDPSVGNHEEDQIEFGAIMKAGLGLTIVTLASYLITAGTFALMASQTDAATAGRKYPMAEAGQNRLPPEPRLQVDPKLELRDFRAAEAATLERHQWVDKTAGVVRIPIEAAMKLTLERGLPARVSAPAAAAETPAPATTAPAAAPQEAGK